MLAITLREALLHHACAEGYFPMAEALGPGWNRDTPFPLLRVLEVRGLKDTLWALRCIPKEQAGEKRRVVSLWLADVLERIEDKMRDERSRAIIPLLREHAVSPVSRERWQRAYDDACDANAAANAAIHAAYAAAIHAAALADAYAAAAFAYFAAYAYADARADAAAAYAYADDDDDERRWQAERLGYYLKQKEAT